jgi:hypothetical protein
VWSVSRVGWYMVVLTCVWNGVLSGDLATCVVVCAALAVVSRSVFCPVGVPCVGLLVHRYVPWCKISYACNTHYMETVQWLIHP